MKKNLTIGEKRRRRRKRLKVFSLLLVVICIGVALYAIRYRNTITTSDKPVKTITKAAESTTEAKLEEEKSEVSIQLNENMIYSVDFYSGLLGQQLNQDGDIANEVTVMTALEPLTKLSNYRQLFQFYLIDTYKQVNEERYIELFKDIGQEEAGKLILSAAKEYAVDAVYLYAHFCVVTDKGKNITVDEYEGVKVYNYFNIGKADDSEDNKAALEFAYTRDWNTPENCIFNTVKWLSTNYIHSQIHTQNTPYKMKFCDVPGYEYHQISKYVDWANLVSAYISDVFATVVKEVESENIFAYPTYLQ